MPAACSTSPMFFQTWSLWASIPSCSLPAESTPTCPETWSTRAPAAPRRRGCTCRHGDGLGIVELDGHAGLSIVREAHGFRSESMASSIKPVHVVGGGLAGSEAAWQLVQAGVPVVLHEMRPVRGTEAHPHRQPRGAGLLQFLPHGRCRQQRRRRDPRGDASRRLADHALRPTRTNCRRVARSRSTGTASRPPCRRLFWRTRSSRSSAKSWRACRPRSGTA